MEQAITIYSMCYTQITERLQRLSEENKELKQLVKAAEKKEPPQMIPARDT